MQYVGTRSLRSLLQFVVSQASEELSHWNWRAERRVADTLTEEEQDEVKDEL